MFYITLIKATDLFFITDYTNRNGLKVDGTLLGTNDQNYNSTLFTMEENDGSTFYLKDVKKDKLLSASNSGNLVTLVDLEGRSALSSFKFVPIEGNRVKIENEGNKKCLQSRGGLQKMILNKCMNIPAQTFNVVVYEDDNILLKNNEGEGYLKITGLSDTELGPIEEATEFDLVKYASGKFGLRIENSNNFLGARGKKLGYKIASSSEDIKINKTELSNGFSVLRVNNKCLKYDRQLRKLGFETCENDEKAAQWALIDKDELIEPTGESPIVSAASSSGSSRAYKKIVTRRMSRSIKRSSMSFSSGSIN